MSDESLRLALQAVRLRARMINDAAIVLTPETIRDTDLPGLVAALQEALTDLQLAEADHAIRTGTSTASEIASTRTEWPADSTPDFPHTMQPRPWKAGEKGGRSGPRK
jgi:hypothetical protein